MHTQTIPTTTLGQWLRAKRAIMQQSSTLAARAIGVSRNTFYFWEYERSLPLIKWSEPIAAWAGVPESVVGDLIIATASQGAARKLREQADRLMARAEALDSAG